MSARLIQQLETLTGQHLPTEYLELLNHYPTTLAAARRAIDDSGMEGLVSQVEFVQCLEGVLFLNLETRSEPILEPEGLEFSWPEQFLVIGETGGGDYYCIDVQGDVEGVMQFNHQAVQFDVVADTLQEFVEILEETFCDPDDTLPE